MSSQQLVQELIGSGVLKNPSLIAAFSAIDRKDFVPTEWKSQAYLNQPLPTAAGQTISQPWTVAFMLEKLEPKIGEKILDIGSGSGYQTALLSYLVSHDMNGFELLPEKWGRVVGLELVPELSRRGAENVSHYNFIAKKIAQIHCLNGAKGYPSLAPYDKIISAATGESIPQAWKDQLKVGGRILAPIGSKIIVLEKKNEVEFETQEFDGFIFVPFVNEEDDDEKDFRP